MSDTFNQEFTPFPGGDRFLTGDATIDKQHHHLLDLINAYGSRVSQDTTVSDSDIRDLMDELIDYTVYHFQTEEREMERLRMDQRHINEHVAEHRHLTADVLQIRDAIGTPSMLAADKVFAFLANWLGFHVLGVDQSLARQLRDIREGISPEDAYHRESQRDAGPVQPLLDAVTGLLTVVRERNQQLVEMNDSLESKVAERTAELTRLSERMESLAVHDQLTGLPNRRYVMQAMETHWNSSARFSVLLIDCDHFKAVNDSLGHTAGDQLLTALAAEMQSWRPSNAILARLGGDEFIVVCPEATLSQALHMAESLRARVSGQRFPAGEGFWIGSLSIGVAQRRGDVPALKELLDISDRGLYAAKARGRDAVASVQSEAADATAESERAVE